MIQKSYDTILNILQEFITTNTGFLTFAIWVIVGLFIAILNSIFGIVSVDLLCITVTACTPVIWIGRNNQILQDFKSYMSGQDSPDEETAETDLENDRGGVWVGN